MHIPQRAGAAETRELQLGGAVVGAVALASGSILKSIAMVLTGLILSMIGTDLHSGVQRFTFGQTHLWEGLDFIVLAVGLFAFGEIVVSLEDKEKRRTFTGKVKNLMPTRDDFRRMAPAILRGTGIGALLGVLPGAGLSMSSFFSYSLEKRVSRYKHEFGKGAIEGVAGPEAANNAAAQTAFVPTLALGIPGSATMALMLGAMIMHNIQPGPGVMTNNPELFWGLIASMWVGNLVLIILNLPLVGFWVKLLQIPYRALYPAILLFCCIGVYSVQLAAFDIFLAVGAGIVGYLFRKLGCEAAPLILGFVLGPIMEENFRRAMILSRGDFSVFFTSPISLALLLVALAMMIVVLLPTVRKRREEVFSED